MKLLAVAKKCAMLKQTLAIGETVTVTLPWAAEHIAVATDGEIYVQFNEDAIVGATCSQYLANEFWTKDLLCIKLTIENLAGAETKVRIEVLSDSR